MLGGAFFAGLYSPQRHEGHGEHGEEVKWRSGKELNIKSSNQEFSNQESLNLQISNQQPTPTAPTRRKRPLVPILPTLAPSWRKRPLVPTQPTPVTFPSNKKNRPNTIYRVGFFNLPI